MKRGESPLESFCGRPVDRGLFFSTDSAWLERMRLPDWAVSFSYYFDGMDRGGKSRLSWAVRSLAASSVRRVYKEWKTASPEMLSSLARIRALDEQGLRFSHYRALVAAVCSAAAGLDSPQLGRRPQSRPRTILAKPSRRWVSGRKGID
jgi:hypothetical protein